MTALDARRLLRRLPGARGLPHRLRTGWERVRPFPLPQYVAGTPRVGGSDPLDLYLPPTAPTLRAAAMSEEAAKFVVDVLGRMTPMKEFTGHQFYYRWAQEKFGKHWRHADLLTTLCAAAYFIRPETYLEIGVCRGRSTAVVGAMSPECAIYGFDLWIPDYGGAPNPGPDFVRDQLRAVSYAGNVTMVSGDSGKTLSPFLREHPDLYFDLITIDGVKTVAGQGTDFANALPRLKVGGIVVSDDIPLLPVLRRVWDKVIGGDSRFASWEFAADGRGVVAAIRVSD